MAEIQIIKPLGCEDECDGERGKRGKRGKRGHRGPSSGALIGQQVFDVAGSGTYTPTPGTRKAIVRGVGGGGGGGGVGATAPGSLAGASGGNSGTAIEIFVEATPGTLLTGGPVVVGTGGVGGVGATLPANGGDSTLVIGGLTLTAPGGLKGGSGGTGFPPPIIVTPGPAVVVVPGADYVAADLGRPGFAITTAATGTVGGDGGSGDYGIGGLGGVQVGDGSVAGGNGAGGGGAAQGAGSNTPVNGGAGSPGLWIIEEYS